MAAVLGERVAQVAQYRTGGDAAYEGGANQQANAPMPCAELHTFFPFDATGHIRAHNQLIAA
jgi:hypothetical protein